MLEVATFVLVRTLAGRGQPKAFPSGALNNQRRGLLNLDTDHPVRAEEQLLMRTCQPTVLSVIASAAGTAMQKKPLPTDFKVLVGMVVVLTIPFALTLMTITQARPLVIDLAANPTPHGYTWSLSLFIVPVMVLAAWVSMRPQNPFKKRAFWITAVLTAGCGILLDVCFGLSFFTFVNRQATLGATFWGYSFAHGWQNVIPIEEIGFYSFGILAVLLVYVWGDEFWFGAYNLDDAPRRSTRFGQVISFHPGSAIFGGMIFALGWLYKKFGAHPWHEGFPGYFLFLTAVAITPSILFFPVANPYINWRAFSLAFLFILLVSLFGEATIAVPYRWWGFQDRKCSVCGLTASVVCRWRNPSCGWV